MVNSKLRRHKVMEKVIKKLMRNNLPPKFKFKDTFNSIEVPVAYQQHLPTQQEVEAEFDAMIAEEEAMPTVDAALEDVNILSTNLYVSSNTGYMGVGTHTPGFMLDVMGDANVAALTATSLNVAALTATSLNVTGNVGSLTIAGNVTMNETTIQGTASTQGSFTSWTQNQKIVPNNPTSYDYFGQHSDISGNGNTIFVAARQEDTTASDSGAVYVYEYDGSSWTQTQMLKASDAGTSDTFGEAGVSLSRDGTVGIVGARGNDDVATDTGSAYIFRKGVNGTWSQDIKLSSDDQEAGDNFGLGVEISGDGNTAFIGEYRDDGINNALTDTGCVHIFKYINSSWVKQTVIRPSNAVASGYFGARISSSYDGTSIAVSNVGKNTSTGSAYIFNLINGTWTQEIELTASNGQANDEFTTELSMSNDGLTVCMGARYEDGATNSQSNSGAVYVFEKINGTWQEVAILRLNNPVADDNLGLRVDISGDGNFIVSGARNRENGSITNAGTVAVFSKTSGTWQFVTELFASDAASSDLFGDSAAISDDGEMILGGAVLEDYSGTDSGSAYVFKGTRTSTPASLNIDSAISVTGDINLTGKLYQNGQAYSDRVEIDINSPDAVSGSWSVGNSTDAWGVPKFNTTYNNTRYNDAPGYVQYNIPSGMSTAYISHLQWSTGGYVDVHGVQADGDLVFLRRINTYQSIENSNHGDPQAHDGATITLAGTGLEHFSAIRLTNKAGRFHMTGMAFTPEKNQGMEGTGMISPYQIVNKGRRIIQYQGYVVQGVYTYGATTGGRYITPLDINIIPNYQNSTIIAHWVINCEAHQDVVYRVYRDSTLIGYNNVGSTNRWSGAMAHTYDQNESSTPSNMVLTWSDNPNTTSPVVYRVYVQSSSTGSYPFYLNRTYGSSNTGQNAYERMVSFRSVMEVSAE